MEPGQTTDDQARAIKEQLDRAEAKIIGFVFNKVSEEKVKSYGDYQFKSLYSPRYYGNYVSNATQEPVTGSRSKELMEFFEHGKVPSELTSGVEKAITAIKTQPRNMVNKIRKSKTNDKPKPKENEAPKSISTDKPTPSKRSRSKPKTNE